MATMTNQIYLYTGTGDSKTIYNTVFLDPSVPLAPEDREVFIDIADGHEPIVARVWMTTEQVQALPTEIYNGLQPVGIVMAGMANAYPASATQTMQPTTLTLATQFFIYKIADARIGFNRSVYEVTLTTIQNWWNHFLLSQTWNQLSMDKYLILNGGSGGYQEVSGSGAGSPTSPSTYSDVVNFLVTAYNDEFPWALYGANGTLPTLSLPFTPVQMPMDLNYVESPFTKVWEIICQPLGIHLVANPFGSTIDWSLVAFDSTNASESASLTALGIVAGYEGAVGLLNDLSIVNTDTPTYSADVGDRDFPVPVEYMYPWDQSTGNEVRNSTINQQGYPVDGTWYFDNLAAGRGTTYPAWTYNRTNLYNEAVTRWNARKEIDYATWIFSGGYPIVPAKTIRRVRITMDTTACGGWFTYVWQHGMLDSGRSKDPNKFFRRFEVDTVPALTGERGIQFRRRMGHTSAHHYLPEIAICMINERIAAGWYSGFWATFCSKLDFSSAGGVGVETLANCSNNVSTESPACYVIHLPEVFITGDTYTIPSNGCIVAIQVGWTSDSPPVAVFLSLNDWGSLPS